jgi:hypothetical protein
MLKNHLQNNFAIFCLIIIALILLSLRIPAILSNPSFGGDSAQRMDNADKIIFQTGNRVWLPFLQLHVNLFYKLGLPFWMFKFIPAFYFLIACIFLGALLYRIFDKSLSGLIISLFFMICFAYQETIIWLSVDVYQVMLGIAFFYILLYLGMLELKKRWSLLIIASIALLTRDDFLLYLLVLFFLNYKKIISNRKYIFAFAWLWAIPIFWEGAMLFRYFLKEGRWPLPPFEWPLAINCHAVLNYRWGASSVVASLLSNRIHFLAGLIIVFLLIKSCYRGKENKGAQLDDFEKRFKVFSLLSLGGIYFFVVVFPSSTYGNTRLGVPLLTHIFIWSGIFYKKTFECPRILKIFTRLILIACMLFMIYGQIGRGWLNKDFSDRLNFSHEIGNLKNEFYKDHKPNACILGLGYFKAVGNFVAPTLYMNRKIIHGESSNSFDDCDILITNSTPEFKDSRFLPYASNKVDNELYTVYYRKKD